MTVPTNTFQRADVRGNREDLIDKIYQVSPEKTPVTNMCGRVKATAVFHEWQTDALAAANENNAMIDGDDATTTATVATQRLGNYLQTFQKTPQVSKMADLIKKAGRGSEMKRVKANKIMELKRDIEKMVLSSNPAVAPTNSVAGKSAGLGVQSAVNALHNGAGATTAWTSGAPTTAVTSGTNRAFTEALLKTLAQNVYVASGEFSNTLVCSPSHKATFSGFTGIAANRFEVKGKQSQGAVIGAADVFMSDFGAIFVMPHYLMVGQNEVYLLNTDFLDLAFMRQFESTPLAKTGDSDRDMVLTDVCLAVRAPSAIGKIDDLTP
jgi:hypothetical protein